MATFNVGPSKSAELDIWDGSAAWPPAEAKTVNLPAAPSGYSVGDGDETRQRASTTLRVSKFHGGPFSDILEPKQTYCEVLAVNFGDISGYLTPELLSVELKITARSVVDFGTDPGYTGNTRNLIAEWYDGYGIYDSSLTYGYYTVRDDWTAADRSAHAIASIPLASISSSSFITNTYSLSPEAFAGVTERGIRLTISGDALDGNHHQEIAFLPGSGAIMLTFHYPDEPPPGADVLLTPVPAEMQLGVYMRAALKVNRAAAGEATFRLEADGTAALDPDRRILDHQARKLRGY